MFQTTRRNRARANGNVPQGQGNGRAEVEEDTFMGGVSDTVSGNCSHSGHHQRMTEDDQDDFVRVVRGVLSNNGNVPMMGGMYQSQPSCSKLDIIRMDCPGGGGGCVADDDQDDLVRVVRGLLDKESQQNRDDQIRREWRMLAEAVDRWLFWSFLLITTVSTLLFLVILPFCHRGKFFWAFHGQDGRRKWRLVLVFTAGSGYKLSTLVLRRWCKKVFGPIATKQTQIFSNIWRECSGEEEKEIIVQFNDSFTFFALSIYPRVLDRNLDIAVHFVLKYNGRFSDIVTWIYLSSVSFISSFIRKLYHYYL